MSPRRNRSQLSVYIYFHVCIKGNGGVPIFVDDQDRMRYLTLIEKYFVQYKIQCFAYCLMTNHVHLLILTPTIAILSRCMHASHIAYVMYFNKRHKRSGHLLEDRFSSWVIWGDKHLRFTKKYIEDNPVKAKIVGFKTQYPWSSGGGARSIVTLYDIKSYLEPSLI